MFVYQFKYPAHIYTFTFTEVNTCMRVCVCVYISSGDGCDTCVLVCTYHPGPQVLLSNSEAFHTLLLSGSRVATPSPCSTAPPHPPRVSDPAGEPEIRRSHEKCPLRSCEVDRGSAGANTAKCPGMAQIRQVGSEEEGRPGMCVCASVFAGWDVGGLVACHNNVGHV